MKAYRVTQPGDCEGRSINTIGIFLNEADALTVFKSGIGNMGMGGFGDPKFYVHPIQVFESIEEFATVDPKAMSLLTGTARQRALATSAMSKLTKDELDALKASL